MNHPDRVKGIPFTNKYNYLGVVINNRGHFDLDEQKAKTRSRYLINKLYYCKKISFENQFLLHSAYIRPYYTYLALILNSQGKTT